VIDQRPEKHEPPPYSFNVNPKPSTDPRPPLRAVSSSRTLSVTQRAHAEPDPKASVGQVHIFHKGRNSIAGMWSHLSPKMTSINTPRSKEHSTLILKYRPSDSTRKAAKHGRRTLPMLRFVRATGLYRWTLRVRGM
jgi:hypothetical protein